MFYKSELYVGSIMQDSVQGKFNAFYACESYITLHVSRIMHLILRKNKTIKKKKKIKVDDCIGYVRNIGKRDILNIYVIFKFTFMLPCLISK